MGLSSFEETVVSLLSEISKELKEINKHSSVTHVVSTHFVNEDVDANKLAETIEKLNKQGQTFI